MIIHNGDSTGQAIMNETFSAKSMTAGEAGFPLCAIGGPGVAALCAGRACHCTPDYAGLGDVGGVVA